MRVFEGVPTMYAAMLARTHSSPAPTTPPPCGVAVSGGASLPVEVLHGFESAFGCPVLEGFGMSETSPYAASNHPDRPRKPGSVGTPRSRVSKCACSTSR